jgi:REP element-mobilizing transposase RayT
MSDFLDPHKDIEKHGAKLPHWQQDEVMLFVTFRLGDSMPASLLKKWITERTLWLRQHPKPWDQKTERSYHLRFTRQLEDWLDEGHGSCLLRDPAHRSILEETLMNDHGSRVAHHAWVIMPNHVHLLFSPNWPIEKLLKSWKDVSARRISKGSIWQRHYRDTLIRDARHFVRAVRYIRRNPMKLPKATYTLWESPRSREV